MSRKKIPNKQALIAALKEVDGNMAAAARKFHCCRRLVWGYVDRDPELRELCNELSETFIDEAESQLYKHIRQGNVVATIFFLKTKARQRGYTERFDVQPLKVQEFEIDIGGDEILIGQNSSGALDNGIVLID